MDYEKKYKEALELMKDCVPDENGLVHVRPCDIFPELQESEDEKTRKEIISALKFANVKGVYDKHIVWLEKQGEQKPVEWSEEDRIMLSSLEWMFTEISKGSDSFYGNKVQPIIDWLKSLKDRIGCEVNCTTTKEWSEEDEKILKEVISNYENSYLPPVLERERILKELKSLEDRVQPQPKQGEQKPTDKVEPKFKVGDWITNGEEIGQVIEWNHPDCIGYKTTYGTEKAFNKEGISQWHKWTIQDAKRGDVLAAHECLVLFKEIDGLNIKCYCTYHYLNHQKFYIDTLQNKTAFCPATKEQRDLLFSKMREAGYEWDADKKKLRELSHSEVTKKSDQVGLTEFENAVLEILDFTARAVLKNQKMPKRERLEQLSREWSVGLLEKARKQIVSEIDEENMSLKGE